MTNHFQPYEERLHLTINDCQQSFLNYPISFWQNISESAGASIISTCQAQRFKHFLLSTSSLLVFDRSVLLLTCAAVGITNALKIILTEAGSVKHIALQKRYTPDRKFYFEQSVSANLRKIANLSNIEEHMFPCAHLISSVSDVPSQESISLLFFYPEINGRDTISTDIFFEITNSQHVLDHTFEDGGYSLNFVWDHSNYITLHYSPESYLSVDISAPSAERSSLIRRLLNIVTARSAFMLSEGQISAEETLILKFYNVQCLIKRIWDTQSLF